MMIGNIIPEDKELFSWMVSSQFMKKCDGRIAICNGVFAQNERSCHHVQGTKIGLSVMIIFYQH